MDRPTDNASRAPEVNLENKVEYPEVVQQNWGRNRHDASHSIDNGAWSNTRQHNTKNADVQDRMLPTAEQRKRGQRIAGVPVWAFWLLLGVLGLIIIGASVGGAVGGSAATRSHDSSSNASNPLSTSPSLSATSATHTSSTISITPSASSIAITNCPDINGTEYTPAGFSKPTPPGNFTQVCGGDYTQPQWFQSNGQLKSARVPSLKACIDMCSYWNLLQASNESTRCTVAALIPNGSPLNCWIRNTWDVTDNYDNLYLALGFLDS